MSAHVASRLSAFLDRELTEAEALQVRQHLADCEVCAAQLQELESATRAFAEMPADPPAGYFDSFSARVRSRIENAPAARTEERPGTGGFRLPAWSWAIAAALLLGILLPQLPWEGRRPGTKAEREGVAGAPPATPATALPPPPAAAAPAAAPAPAAPPERFAAAPTPRASPTRTETTDLAARRRVEEPAVGIADGLAPAARPAEAPQAMKKDSPEQDIARAKSNEAARLRLEEPRPRPEGFADAPAAPAEEVDLAAAALGKSEDEGPPAAAEARAGAVGAGRVPEVKRPPAGSAKEARATGVAAEPDAQAQFDALKARRPASLTERRRLREAWRSFLARDPEGPRADEARVAVVAASVEIAVESREPADQAQARRDGEDYLSRSDAAQKARVQALLLRLEGSR